MISKLDNALLSLVRLGIGHQGDVLLKDIDWHVLYTQSNRHGLAAIVLDGIEQLPESQRPPKAMLLSWIGSTLIQYEQRYSLYRKGIASLSAFYRENGYKMMVLKGYACSLDWPKPEHRPCGDIDIWQFGEQETADDALRQSGVKIDKSHHHHTVFTWKGFMVENHYDFINVYAHKSSREIEKIFKELGGDDSYFFEVCGEKVYVPSPNLHALFLIRHLISHFAAAEITLRQVLDWAFFVEKHTKEVDWEWLMEVLEKYHMKAFINCINAICVEDLVFSLSIFPAIQSCSYLKEKVLDDILNPEYTTAEPKRLLARLIYKYRRWQGNAWKQKMCYGESRWSAFVCGIWAKLLKPKSI